MSRGRLVGGSKGRAPEVDADNDGRGRMARESRLGRGRMASVRRESWRVEAGIVALSGALSGASSAGDGRKRLEAGTTASSEGSVAAEGGCGRVA
jgi:hypothetical protein